MEFKKYQHVERFGMEGTRGIEEGTTYVFPKIDGTNASVWLDDGIIKAGSRNRDLSIGDDNAGFRAWVKGNLGILNFFALHKNLRLYGEWLVPHSLRTYREDAWRDFYVFDVMYECDDEIRYLTYDEYKPLLEQFNIKFIPPITIIKNGCYETFIRVLKGNVFLIKDGEGVGEGIVIKNYDYKNPFGRQIWAKIVTNEFKEKHVKEMGASVVTVSKVVEETIIADFCTESLIEKEYYKLAYDGWVNRYIPLLLERVFYDLINDEMGNIIIKYKNPTINFKTLRGLVTSKIKEVKPEIFGIAKIEVTTLGDAEPKFIVINETESK